MMRRMLLTMIPLVLFQHLSSAWQQPPQPRRPFRQQMQRPKLQPRSPPAAAASTRTTLVSPAATSRIKQQQPTTLSTSSIPTTPTTKTAQRPRSRRYFAHQLWSPPFLGSSGSIGNNHNNNNGKQRKQSNAFNNHNNNKQQQQQHNMNHHTVVGTTSTTCTSNSFPIWYTNDPAVVSEWLQTFVFGGGEHSGSYENNNGIILGFDVESVPKAPWIRSYLEGPVVIQLATPTHALVVQLVQPRNTQQHSDSNDSKQQRRSISKRCRRSAACLPILQAVLSDASIGKAGVGIDDDAIVLYEQLGLETSGRIELTDYTWPDNDESFEAIGGTPTTPTANNLSLKRCAANWLNIDLPKPKRLSCSDWSKWPLTDAQVVYAARDAWTAAAIVVEATNAANGNPHAQVPNNIQYSNAAHREPSVADLIRRRNERRILRKREKFQRWRDRRNFTESTSATAAKITSRWR